MLASNHSDGMVAMSASNFARPLNTFAAMRPLPVELSKAGDYAEAFIDWSVDRQKTKANKLSWSHPSTLHDAGLFIHRKIWAEKVRLGLIYNDQAKVIATTVELHKKYRADVHEALNHAAKHNEDVKLLRAEMVEQLDDIVRDRLTQTTEAIAGAALVSLPDLKAALLEHME